jgi:hypothetical protein
MVNVGVKPFDTNVFFSGGAGMFLQYHDVVKPTFLTAVFKILLSNLDVGLPVQMIRPLSILSLTEWYLRRRYWNPLKCLDYQHLYSDAELDKILMDILASDDSVYSLGPILNIRKLLAAYSKQQMRFPIFIYTEDYEEHVKTDCKSLFPGIKTTYLHGKFEDVLQKCDNNFTYMIANHDLYQRAVVALHGTYSHLLLAGDYRYNFRPRDRRPKCDLPALMAAHPFVRLETNNVCDPTELAIALKNLSDRFRAEGKGI